MPKDTIHAQGHALATCPARRQAATTAGTANLPGSEGSEGNGAHGRQRPVTQTPNHPPSISPILSGQ